MAVLVAAAVAVAAVAACRVGAGGGGFSARADAMICLQLCATTNADSCIGLDGVCHRQMQEVGEPVVAVAASVVAAVQRRRPLRETRQPFGSDGCSRLESRRRRRCFCRRWH